jgi:hypothetical protein
MRFIARAAPLGRHEEAAEIPARLEEESRHQQCGLNPRHATPQSVMPRAFLLERAAGARGLIYLQMNPPPTVCVRTRASANWPGDRAEGGVTTGLDASRLGLDLTAQIVPMPAAGWLLLSDLGWDSWGASAST